MPAGWQDASQALGAHDLEVPTLTGKDWAAFWVSHNKMARQHADLLDTHEQTKRELMNYQAAAAARIARLELATGKTEDDVFAEFVDVSEGLVQRIKDTYYNEGFIAGIEDAQEAVRLHKIKTSEELANEK